MAIHLYSIHTCICEYLGQETDRVHVSGAPGEKIQSCSLMFAGEGVYFLKHVTCMWPSQAYFYVRNDYFPTGQKQVVERKVAKSSTRNAGNTSLTSWP